MNFDWAKQFNGAVTICDREGIIVYMNDRSVAQFQKYGGEKLIGQNLMNCHSPASRVKLAEMLKKPTENTYLTEKNGIRKIIIQTPWIENDEFKGIVEIGYELPADLPLHQR
jgi:transcriptional regulator with PAS, ATPase and Fis domain